MMRVSNEAWLEAVLYWLKTHILLLEIAQQGRISARIGRAAAKLARGK